MEAIHPSPKRSGISCLRGVNEVNDSELNQQKALQLMISDELTCILDILKDLDVENPTTKLDDYHHRYCTFFSNLLERNIEFPDLYIVDNFPKPYDKFKVEALAPDKADEEMYGIPSGVYLLKDFLAPYYSAYLLPHEIVHVIIGKPNPHLLGRGLEEGIADLFGSIYGGMYVLGENIITNLTIYNRLSHLSPRWDIYKDYLRQAACIYRNYGLEGIVELVLGGRDIIKKIEKEMLLFNVNLSLPSGKWDEKLGKVLDSLLSAFIENLVVSPLAKYISARISVGDNIKSILKEDNINKSQGIRAINELQDNIFIMLINEEGTIDYYDDWISKHLRYKIVRVGKRHK